MSEQDKLPQSVDVGYTLLHDLLVGGQWQKADSETGTVMLKIADRIKEGWLRESDITKFPQLDLQTIDYLWVKHSQERFGFSVQSCIWKNVEQDYGKFSDAVGWRLNYRWRQYSELIFKTEAPMGHLPAAPFFKSNLAIGWAATLMPKLAQSYTIEHTV
ncbi:GUN4 domain-containing protein [Nostoc flagelliforme]|nr:GUN4 domain-containing protein [Nostoc flagelliforme]